MSNRIQRNDHTWTHPKANKWLTEFMINLKKMVLIEEDYQPFTMAYLDEWSEHRRDIESCVDYMSSMVKHISNDLVPEHMDIISCFNQIIIDLKLMVIGEKYNPITPERIEEADGYYMKLHHCRKQRTIYY